MDPTSHAFSRHLACMAGHAYPHATPSQQQVADSLGMMADNPKMGPMMRALTEDDSLMAQPQMAAQGTYPQNSYPSSHQYHNHPFSPGRTPQNLPFYQPSHLNSTASADYTTSALQSPGYGISPGFGHYQRQIPTPSPVMGGGIGSPNGHHGASYPRSASAGPTIPSPVMMQGSSVYSNSHASPANNMYGHGLQTSSSQMSHSSPLPSRNMRSPAALHSPKSLPTSSPIPFTCSSPSSVNSVAYGQSMPPQAVSERQQNVYSTSKSPGVNRTFQYSPYNNNQGMNPQHSLPPMSRNRPPDLVDQRVKSPPYVELVHSKSPPPLAKQSKVESAPPPPPQNCNIADKDRRIPNKQEGVKKDKGSLPKLEEMVAVLGEPIMKENHPKQHPSSESVQGIKEQFSQYENRLAEGRLPDSSIQKVEASIVTKAHDSVVKGCRILEAYDQQRATARSINHSSKNPAATVEADGNTGASVRQEEVVAVGNEQSRRAEGVLMNGVKSQELSTSSRSRNSSSNNNQMNSYRDTLQDSSHKVPIKEKHITAENKTNSSSSGCKVHGRTIVSTDRIKELDHQSEPRSKDEAVKREALSMEGKKESDEDVEINPNENVQNVLEIHKAHKDEPKSGSEIKTPSEETVAKKDVKGIVTLIPNPAEGEIGPVDREMTAKESFPKVKQEQREVEQDRKNGPQNKNKPVVTTGNGHHIPEDEHLNPSRNCQVRLNNVLHTSDNEKKIADKLLQTRTSHSTADCNKLESVSKGSGQDSSSVNLQPAPPICGEVVPKVEKDLATRTAVGQSQTCSTPELKPCVVVETVPAITTVASKNKGVVGLDVPPVQNNDVDLKSGNAKLNRTALVTTQVPHVKKENVDKEEEPGQIVSEQPLRTGVNTAGQKERVPSPINANTQGPLFLIAKEESQLKFNEASVVITPLRLPGPNMLSNLKRKRPIEEMPTGDQSTLPLKKRKGRPPGSKSKSKKDNLSKHGKKKGNKQLASLDVEEQQALRKFKHLQQAKKSKQSDSPSRGPTINVRGSLDNVLASEVINSDSGPSKYRRAPRMLGIPSSVTSKGPTANPSTITVHPRGKWRCAFCGKRSFYGPLGDLFGPYYPTGFHFEQVQSAHDMKKDHSTPSYSLSSNVPPHRKMPSKNEHAKGNQKPLKTYPGKTKNGPTFLSSSPPPSNVKVVRVFPVQGQKHDESGTSGMTSPKDRAMEKEMERDEVWVHEDCLIWSQGVFAIGETLYGLHAAVKEATLVVSCDASLTIYPVIAHVDETSCLKTFVTFCH